METYNYNNFELINEGLFYTIHLLLDDKTVYKGIVEPYRAKRILKQAEYYEQNNNTFVGSI